MDQRLGRTLLSFPGEENPVAVVGSQQLHELQPADCIFATAGGPFRQTRRGRLHDAVGCHQRNLHTGARQYFAQWAGQPFGQAIVTALRTNFVEAPDQIGLAPPTALDTQAIFHVAVGQPDNGNLGPSISPRTPRRLRCSFARRRVHCQFVRSGNSVEPSFICGIGAHQPVGTIDNRYGAVPGFDRCTGDGPVGLQHLRLGRVGFKTSGQQQHQQDRNQRAAIRQRHHRLLADQPHQSDGNDAGRHHSQHQWSRWKARYRIVVLHFHASPSLLRRSSRRRSIARRRRLRLRATMMRHPMLAST